MEVKIEEMDRAASELVGEIIDLQDEIAKLKKELEKAKSIKRQYLTVKHLATYLDKSYWKVYDMLNKKAFPCIKEGTSLFIDIDDVKKYMDSKKEYRGFPQ